MATGGVSCRWANEGDIASIPLILDVVNPSYAEAEKDMWRDAFLRTTAEELTELIGQKQLALALLENRIVGTCKIAPVPNEGTYDIGMVACPKELRGKGIGNHLLQFFEDFCVSQGCKEAQVEVLFPKVDISVHKQNTLAWYKRHGYEERFQGDFAAVNPNLSTQVFAKDCIFVVFRKTLNPN